jgi:superfamily II DNA helicase RecQ
MEQLLFLSLFVFLLDVPVLALTGTADEKTQESKVNLLTIKLNTTISSLIQTDITSGYLSVRSKRRLWQQN